MMKTGKDTRMKREEMEERVTEGKGKTRGGGRMEEENKGHEEDREEEKEN